jgi:uncharacterized protein (TIGR02466 family)
MTEKLMRLFATPVIVDELDDAPALNSELEQAILAQQSGDEGLKLSNRGGWQSKRDFPQWGGPSAETLVNKAIQLASAHSVTSDSRAPTWHVDSWANVSRNGNFNMPHVHGGSFWSAVYYVRPGDGSGGELVLHDPRMPALRMHAPGVQFKDVGPELRLAIQPRSGMMVLFPAWLSHSVEPWEGEGQRISVAMNIRASGFAK